MQGKSCAPVIHFPCIISDSHKSAGLGLQKAIVFTLLLCLVMMLWWWNLITKELVTLYGILTHTFKSLTAVTPLLCQLPHSHSKSDLSVFSVGYMSLKAYIILPYDCRLCIMINFVVIKSI